MIQLSVAGNSYTYNMLQKCFTQNAGDNIMFSGSWALSTISKLDETENKCSRGKKWKGVLFGRQIGNIDIASSAGTANHFLSFTCTVYNEHHKKHTQLFWNGVKYTASVKRITMRCWLALCCLNHLCPNGDGHLGM